jgi:hypothetical protein
MKLRSLIFIGVVGLTGCVGGDEGDDQADPRNVAPNPPTLRGHLATPRGMSLPAGGTVQLKAERKYDGAQVATPALPVEIGRLAMRAEYSGALVIDQLTFDVANITVGREAIPPDGVTLTDIQVRLAHPVTIDRTVWSDDGSFASGDVRFDLLLDWAILGGSDQVFPLATQHIEGVPARLSVGLGDDGIVTATLDAETGGVFWSWAGIIELSDLHLVLQAVER